MTWDNLTLVLAVDGESAPPNVDQSSSQVQQAASDTTLQPSGQDGDPPQPRDQGFGMMIWLLPLALVFIMLSMGGRKEKKKHAALMAALAKGDKVRTAGGILGTVVEVRDEEIVVKVDENANTRLRFARSAISSIVESKSGD